MNDKRAVSEARSWTIAGAFIGRALQLRKLVTVRMIHGQEGVDMNAPPNLDDHGGESVGVAAASKWPPDAAGCHAHPKSKWTEVLSTRCRNQTVNGKRGTRRIPRLRERGQGTPVGRG